MKIVNTNLDPEGFLQIDKECENHPWSLEQIRTSISKKGSVVTSALDQNVTVGWCLAQLIAGQAEIYRFGVLPKHRCAGVGTRLLEGILGAFTEERVTSVNLEVRSSAESALLLYKRFGFEEVGKRTCYYRDGSDALLLKLTVK